MVFPFTARVAPVASLMNRSGTKTFPFMDKGGDSNTMRVPFTYAFLLPTVSTRLMPFLVPVICCLEESHFTERPKLLNIGANCTRVTPSRKMGACRNSTLTPSKLTIFAGAAPAAGMIHVNSKTMIIANFNFTSFFPPRTIGLHSNNSLLYLICVLFP